MFYVSVAYSCILNWQIQSKSFNVIGNSEFNSSLYIDASIGQNTVFTFTWSNGNTAPDITIISPSECYYANYYTYDSSLCAGGTSSYTESTTFKTIQFDIPGVAEVWCCYMDFPLYTKCFSIFRQGNGYTQFKAILTSGWLRAWLHQHHLMKLRTRSLFSQERVKRKYHLALRQFMQRCGYG